MELENNHKEKKQGRIDVIKGIGWLLLPLLIGYLIFLLT